MQEWNSNCGKENVSAGIGYDICIQRFNLSETIVLSSQVLLSGSSIVLLVEQSSEVDLLQAHFLSAYCLCSSHRRFSSFM